MWYVASAVPMPATADQNRKANSVGPNTATALIMNQYLAAGFTTRTWPL